MDASPRTARRLLELAQPFLNAQDSAALAAALRREWSAPRLADLVAAGSNQTAAVAAKSLGLIGGPSAVPVLASALHHADPEVVAAAEDALWSIWFRAAGPEAQDELFHAMQYLDQDRPDAAVAALTELIQRRPKFAEAFHQRGMAYYVQDRLEPSLSDYHRTLQMNPYHFAARAGTGNCLAHLGRHAEALDHYGAALEIHPRMEGVRQIMRQVRELLGLDVAADDTAVDGDGHAAGARYAPLGPDAGSIERK